MEATTGNKAKVPNCELEIIEVGGRLKVKASCQDMADAIDLRDVLDNEPVEITVKAKGQIISNRD